MYVIQVHGETELTNSFNKLLYHKVYFFKPSKKEIEKAVKACEAKDGLDIAGLDLSKGYDVKILKLKLSLW